MSESAEPTLSALKSRAQLTKVSVHLGKAGITPEFLASLEAALGKGGLVKMRFEGLKDERKTLSRQLAEQTGSRLIQQVGHTAVFYRAKPSAPAAPEATVD